MAHNMQTEFKEENLITGYHASPNKMHTIIAELQ
jgi:hypothetical protein